MSQRLLIVAIGVTNQRETTILWDKYTGKVLHNALVWLDARTQETVDFLLEQHNKKTRLSSSSFAPLLSSASSDREEFLPSQETMRSAFVHVLLCIKNSLVDR